MLLQGSSLSPMAQSGDLQGTSSAPAAGNAPASVQRQVMQTQPCTTAMPLRLKPVAGLGERRHIFRTIVTDWTQRHVRHLGYTPRFAPQDIPWHYRNAASAGSIAGGPPAPAIPNDRSPSTAPAPAPAPAEPSECAKAARQAEQAAEPAGVGTLGKRRRSSEAPEESHSRHQPSGCSPESQEVADQAAAEVEARRALLALINSIPDTLLAASEAPASQLEQHMPFSLVGTSAAGLPDQQRSENRSVAGGQDDGIRLALKQTQDMLAAQQAHNVQLQQEVARLKAVASNNIAFVADLKQELDACRKLLRKFAGEAEAMAMGLDDQLQ